MKTLKKRRADSVSSNHRTRSRATQQDRARQKLECLFGAPIKETPKPREVLSIHRIKMKGQAKDRELFVVSRRDSIDPDVAPLGVYRLELTKRRSKDNRRRIKNAFRRVFGEHIEGNSWTALCDYSRAQTFERLVSLKQLGEVTP